MKRVLLCAACLVVVFFGCFIGNANAAVFSDSFAGTSLNTSNWTLMVTAGPSGQYTVNDGLDYLGSTGNDASALLANVAFSGSATGVMQFSGFSSSTVIPPNPGPAPESSLALVLGPSSSQVVLGYGVGSSGWLGVFSIQFSSGVPESTVAVYEPEAAGQLQFTYDGTTLNTYCNMGGSGWQFLASYNPGWTGPVPFVIAGVNAPNGTTSFTVDSISVSGSGVPTPLPAATLLLGPGLVGLAVLRRRFGE